MLGLVPKIDVPLAGGVPITAQALGVTLAGVLLGGVRGALAAAVFLIAVAFGAPILAGGRGGLGVFTGPTAGFLFGFVPAAFITGVMFYALVKRLGLFLAGTVAAFIGGYVVLNLIGIPVVAWVGNKTVREAVDIALSLLPGGVAKSLATGAIVYLMEGIGPRGGRG